MTLIISPCFVSFFINTSRTTTSGFCDISLEYLCKICFGIALLKVTNPDICILSKDATDKNDKIGLHHAQVIASRKE